MNHNAASPSRGSEEGNEKKAPVVVVGVVEVWACRNPLIASQSSWRLHPPCPLVRSGARHRRRVPIPVLVTTVSCGVVVVSRSLCAHAQPVASPSSLGCGRVSDGVGAVAVCPKAI